MQIFSYLLLAHLIGDYPLQPILVYNWKTKSWHGVLFHVFIHLIVTTIFLTVYLASITAIKLALILCVIHFIIDYTKTSTEKYTKNYIVTYWLDQSCHLVSIMIVSLLAFKWNVQPESFANQNIPLISWFFEQAIILYFSLVVFLSYTIEYGSFQKKRQLGLQAKAKFNKKAIVKRLFIGTLIYIGLLFAFQIM
jgi:hypothetical protein